MSWASEVLADSPVAWFRLGEARGTSATDAVGGAAGTYVGGVTLGQPSLLAGDPSDTCADFNGSTGLVEIADRAELDFGDVFTLECWFQLDTGGANRTLFGKGMNAPVWRLTSGNQLRIRKNGVADVATTTTTLSTGTTYHAVVTKSGPTTRLYVDAVDVTGTVTDSTCTNNTTAAQIGAANSSDFFDGRIDEFAIYSTALSSARVLAHYQAGVTAPVATRPHRMLLLGVG